MGEPEGPRQTNPVFLVLAHQDPPMFARLVRTLAPYRVIVHVDQKVDQDGFRAGLTPADLERTTFLDDRIRVNWGAYSQTTAIRSVVRAGIASSLPEDYLILLSGQDYPLRSMTALQEFLAARSGTQFLRFFPIAEAGGKYRGQVDQLHFRDLPLLTGQSHIPALKRIRNGVISSAEKAAAAALPVRRPPESLHLAHGSSHFAMTAGFAARLETRSTPEVENFFRGVFASDEKFYHSLAFSLGDQAQGVPQAETFVGPGNWRYSNLHHIHESLTKLYTEADWDEVSASDKFFLRKVRSGVSDGLLDRIDRELG